MKHYHRERDVIGRVTGIDLADVHPAYGVSLDPHAETPADFVTEFLAIADDPRRCRFLRSTRATGAADDRGIDGERWGYFIPQRLFLALVRAARSLDS